MDRSTKKVLWLILSHHQSSFLQKPILKCLKNNISFDKLEVIWLNTNPNGNTHIRTKDDIIEISVPKSNWKKELQSQLIIVKNNLEYTHAVVMLDDFVFTNAIDESLLFKCFEYASQNQVKYLRLKNDPFSLMGTLLKTTTKLDDNCSLISENHPYYCALQVAIWDIDYFERILRQSQDIWDFETRHSQEKHYMKDIKLVYYHVLEKNMWIYYYKKLFAQNGISIANFPYKEIGLKRKTRYIARIKFFIFGFSYLILKRKFTYLFKDNKSQ